MVDYSYALNMFSQGNIFSFPVIVAILVIIFYFIITLFLKWTKESNNPYFFYELLRQHKTYVNVIYLKELNNNSFIIDSVVKEPYGAKGLYFKKYNTLLPLMEELIIKGSNQNNYVFAKVYSSNAVVPIKVVDLNEIKQNADEKALVIIKGLEEKQNLFLEHNFSTLVRAQTEIAKRGQGILGFLRDNGGAIIVLVSIVLGMAVIYMYSSETAKNMQEKNLAQFQEIKGLYASFYEKQQFCDKIVSKYATDWEKTLYYNLPSPFDKNATSGG